MNQILNTQSSQESKRSAVDAVFNQLSDYLFERVNLISGTFATAGGTTSTTDYDMSLRVPDTSVRQFMSPDRRLRFRCTFYITAPLKADCYILVPATLNSTTAPVSVSDLYNYVGLKINQGAVSLVSKDSRGTTSKSIETTITTDATYYLEIQYNVSFCDIYLNDTFLGSITCNLGENLYQYETFYPIIAPIRSTDATNVNITMESYQILQDK